MIKLARVRILKGYLKKKYDGKLILSE